MFGLMQDRPLLISSLIEHAARAEGRPYAAVIMDLTIPGGMGGKEAIQRLLEIDPQVRAIVSSGYDNDEMVQRYLDLGFRGYLTKPYRVADLGRRSAARAVGDHSAIADLGDVGVQDRADDEPGAGAPSPN